MTDQATIQKPSVTIHYCGGTGIAIGERLQELLTSDLMDMRIGAGVIQVGYDTSNVDIVDKGDAIPFRVQTIGNEAGSGKHRVTNAGPIMSFFKSLETDDLEIGDINIVVSSTSGGTGPICSWSLISEFHRRRPDAVTIHIAVTDSSSRLDVTNTRKQMESLNALAINNKIYLPIVMFDNRWGRSVVDEDVNEFIGYLLTLIRAQMREYDRKDRINSFRAHATIGATPGLRPFRLFSKDLNIRSQVYDLPIKNPTDIRRVDVDVQIRDADGNEYPNPLKSGDGTPNAISGVTYPGKFVSKGIDPMVMVIDATDHALKRFIDGLDNSLTMHSALTDTSSAIVSTFGGGDGMPIL